MAEFICPVCGKPLRREEKSFVCPNGHCFDIAKSGYVNLLMSSSGGHHGDDRLMVRARKALLDKGYYDRLSSEIAACVLEHAKDGCTVLDAGCGEGKYTADVLSALTAAGLSAQMIGIDISKAALQYAAKRSPALQLAVASSAKLPLASESTDVVLNIFSPFIPEEFARVLRPGGILIRAVPLERHLWELKQLIYDTPYENTPDPTPADGFELIGTRDVCCRIRLDSNEDIMSLFMMTPYYYKTGRADQEKAQRAQSLETRLEFRILLYKKVI